MGRMVRKQIYIEPEQARMLKQQAKELGIAESNLIRRGISQLGHPLPVAFLDRKAWQEELSFIRKRARRRALSRQRNWTREELYEERLQRFSLLIRTCWSRAPSTRGL
jgi:hypothetical protein